MVRASERALRVKDQRGRPARGLPGRAAGLETVYNTIRPHQLLRYLTPAKYLASKGHVRNGSCRSTWVATFILNWR